MKQALRSGCRDGLSLERALASFLLRYRCTPHATTGVSPSCLFLGRNIRTRLDLLKPNVGARVMSQQDKQKAHHDRHSQYRELEIRQPVWARNFREGPRWVQGIVADRIGPLSYLVKLPDGDLWRRKIDHLREGGKVVQSPLLQCMEMIFLSRQTRNLAQPKMRFHDAHLVQHRHPCQQSSTTNLVQRIRFYLPIHPHHCPIYRTQGPYPNVVTRVEIGDRPIGYKVHWIDYQGGQSSKGGRDVMY